MTSIASLDAVPDEDLFRREVRAFFDANLPRKGSGAKVDADGVTRAREYQALLATAGLAGISWPSEYGGRGLPRRYERIFDSEASGFELPPRALEIGLGMCAPTLLAHASEEQKLALIPALLRGEHVWCELFSEPGAGSDLAGVRTTARSDGDEYVVDGQKVWTSGAQYSDLGMCLVRTDPDRPKRDGISMVIVDMHAPGITVRPLRQMTGESHFNEVFLEGVRVPRANVVGDENLGWRVARTMLAFERQALSSIGAGGAGKGGGFSSLVSEAGNRNTAADPVVRELLVRLRIRQMVLRFLSQYLEVGRRAGRGSGGEPAMLKLAMARFVKESAETGVTILGPASVAWDPSTRAASRWSMQLLSSRSASLGGGTDEVVKNVIAERVLGLPRDVEVDADIPFRESMTGTGHGF